MILIVGAGAVGTILATHLAAAGRDVGLYARPKDVTRFGPIEQVRTDFPADSNRPALTAPRPTLVTALDLVGVEAVVIGVKFPDLDALLAQLPDPIPPTCTLVSTLNGVAPLRVIRAARPAARVVPMSVIMNGQLLAPLHARLATRAEIVLGDPDPTLIARFESTGVIVKTAHGEEAVWGKLLINLANAICALTRTTFKDLFLDPHLRRVYVAVLDETTGVLDAARIAWKMPLVLPYGVYRWALLHGGPLPWWFAKYRNGVREGAYPSMVADVENGRVTEVEQLNGEVVRLGRETGFPTPANAALVSLIGQGSTPAKLTSAQLRRSIGVR